MNEKPFDPAKPYRQRCGRKAVIIDKYCGSFTVAVKDEHDLWEVFNYDGYRHFTDNSKDLINIPEERTLSGWLNVYEDKKSGHVHNVKEQADSVAAHDLKYHNNTRIALLDLSSIRCPHCSKTHPITYREGEGL